MAFKICNIGCGGISGSCHGPSYVKYRAENPDTELAACCDLDNGKALEYSKRFGFARCYADFEQMLMAEKPDAVCVTVNEEYTAGVAAKVLDMGFAAFIEKPPGKNTAETRLLIEAAQRSGQINQVGYNRRYMPILVKLKEMLYAPHDLQFIRYDFYRVGRRDADFSDTAVHGIDAVRYIAGADYANVHFSYQPLPQYGENVQNIYMDCEMTSGARAQLSFCPVSGAVIERAAVHAKDNIWMANAPVWADSYDKPGELLHIAGGKTASRISGAQLCGGSDEVYITNGFYNENKAFFDCVKAGHKSGCDLEQALSASLIKDCITNKESHYKAK
ncbi:MAG: Gfo/Idh/MocA family oxidoreductase [Oscillospiraceae bacterium]|nr:Gfo/Idh/MocA family oxidoreductase [Oscillospiraceae bacterium]